MATATDPNVTLKIKEQEKGRESERGCELLVHPFLIKRNRKKIKRLNRSPFYIRLGEICTQSEIYVCIVLIA